MGARYESLSPRCRVPLPRYESSQFVTKVSRAQGRTGICAVKTNQAIIIGHYGEDQQVGNATVTVEALADYLVGLSY